MKDKPMNSTLSMIGLQQVYRAEIPSTLKKHRGSGQSAMSRTFFQDEREEKMRNNLSLRFDELQEARKVRSKEEWLTPQQTEEYRRQQYKLLLLRQRELEKAYKRNQLVLSDCIRAQRDYATYESYLAEELQLQQLTTEMQDFICDLVKPLSGPLDELADQSMIRDIHNQDTLSDFGISLLHSITQYRAPDVGVSSLEIFQKSMALTATINAVDIKRFQTQISGQFSCVQIFPSRQFLRISCAHLISNPLVEIPITLRALSNSKLISLLEYTVNRKSSQNEVTVYFAQQLNKEVKKMNSIFWLPYKLDSPNQEKIESLVLCKGRTLIPRFVDIDERVTIEIEIGKTKSKELNKQIVQTSIGVSELRYYGFTDRDFRRYLTQNITFENLLL